jgi:HSP20 family molecular chaperone IbpA
MRRTIRLPAPVDADAASATYRNGVLAVRLPAVADADVRHIDVE